MMRTVTCAYVHFACEMILQASLHDPLMLCVLTQTTVVQFDGVFNSHTIQLLANIIFTAFRADMVGAEKKKKNPCQFFCSNSPSVRKSHWYASKCTSNIAYFPCKHGAHCSLRFCLPAILLWHTFYRLFQIFAEYSIHVRFSCFYLGFYINFRIYVRSFSIVFARRHNMLYAKLGQIIFSSNALTILWFKKMYHFSPIHLFLANLFQWTA